MLRWIQIAVFLSVSALGSTGEVCFSDYCEFHMTISFGETMMKVDEGTLESELELSRDCLHVRGEIPTRSNCQEVAEVPTLEEARPRFSTGGQHLVTGDGHRRRIILVNGQFPGPTLEVGHNSQVVVHVKNDMGTVGTAIHWHGMRMMESPWMDGVAFLTQCPILPHQTFTYSFRASPPGTHWYHSHMGNQRRDGPYGLLVVHEDQPKMPEFPLIVQDWFHAQGFTERSTDLRLQKGGEEPGPVSALINGRKGLSTDEDQAYSPSVLLNTITTFRVNQGEQYRFRTVNPGGDLPYEISLDNHKMVIVALDGFDIVPLTVDSFVIHAGERVDFVIKADQPAASYWLRANPVEIQEGEAAGQTSEVEQEEEEDPETVKVKAIIIYDNLMKTLPNSTRECTASKTCIMFNCAFPPPPSRNEMCIPLADVRSTKPLAKNLGQDVKVVEKFFNIGDNWHDSINARRHIQPWAPLYPHSPSVNYGVVDCEEVCGDITKGCECTHMVSLPHDETIQVVFTNLEPPSTGLHPGHPMHIHGHHFAVVAQGFAEFDATTGLKTSDNLDVKCDSPLFKYIFWAREHPRFNLVDPPMKDTVIVPPGGYTVLRFRTDNPGYWFLHCHILFDMIEGMAAILKVAPEKVPQTPGGFPTCLPFNQSLASIKNGPQSEDKPGRERPVDGSTSSVLKEGIVNEEREEGNSNKDVSDGRSNMKRGSNDRREDGEKDGDLRLTVPSLVGIVLGSVVLGALLAGFPLLCVSLCGLSKLKKRNAVSSKEMAEF